jgi:hypothetical protein
MWANSALWWPQRWCLANARQSQLKPVTLCNVPGCDELGQNHSDPDR